MAVFWYARHIFGILAHSEMLGVALGEAVKHIVHGVLETFIILPYLAMMDITKKWTGRRQDWSVIHAQLAVFFADRMLD